MLTAYYNGEIVYAQQAANKNVYLCPACMQQVILRKGNLKIPHFAHMKNSDCINQQDGETNEHLNGKQQMIEFINPHPAKLEVYLKEINQRPDILMGNLAIEFQCSPIGVKRLTQRINGYQDMKMRSLWILGNNYRRKFGSTSMNKFFYYIKGWGFCMFFWNTHNHDLEMRFNCQFVNSKLRYQKMFFYTWDEFIHKLKFPPKNLSYDHNIDDLLKELTNIRNKIFYHDKFALKLQNLCYLKGHDIAAAPLVCHFQNCTTPVVGRKYLYWKILILNYLDNDLQVEQLYKKSVELLKISESYPLIKNVDKFKRQAFSDFLADLCKSGYIIIKENNIYVKKYPAWFNDYYRKIQYIIMKV